MHFNYTILGRTPGKPNTAQFYRGVVEAENPKEALLEALAAEFGDKADGDTAYEQLDSGWDDGFLEACYSPLPATATTMLLPCGTVEYDVEVSEVAEFISDAQIIAQAEAAAPDDIDDIRASDRFI